MSTARVEMLGTYLIEIRAKRVHGQIHCIMDVVPCEGCKGKSAGMAQTITDAVLDGLRRAFEPGGIIELHDRRPPEQQPPILPTYKPIESMSVGELFAEQGRLAKLKDEIQNEMRLADNILARRKDWPGNRPLPG